MMEMLREWIVGITCVSVLLAAAQSLMPEGNIRKIGNLAGGLLLILTMAAPLTKIDMNAISLPLTEYRMANSNHAELLELENSRLLKELIEEQTEAYILDKAQELGANCTVEVYYEYSDEGTAYPVAVTVRGNLNEEQKRKLSQRIESDLAVTEENQHFEEGETQ